MLSAITTARPRLRISVYFTAKNATNFAAPKSIPLDALSLQAKMQSMETAPSTTVQAKREFSVTMSERVHRWGGGVHWSLFLSFGAYTLTEARDRAFQEARAYEKHHGKPVGFVIRRFCNHCDLSGVEPGTTDDECTACRRTGKVALSVQEMAQLLFGSECYAL